MIELEEETLFEILVEDETPNQIVFALYIYIYIYI